jgi:hypothetical protein
MHFQLQVTLPYTGLMYIAIIKLEGVQCTNAY